MSNLQKRLDQAKLGQFFTAGTLVSNNASTLASTAAATAVGDIQDANIREINNLALDIAEVRDTVDTLLAVLRDNNLIRS